MGQIWDYVQKGSRAKQADILIISLYCVFFSLSSPFLCSPKILRMTSFQVDLFLGLMK